MKTAQPSAAAEQLLVATDDFARRPPQRNRGQRRGRGLV